MLYGDLEGKGKIYDEEGIVIPVRNECVMASFNGYVRKVERNIRHKWRVEFFDGLGVFLLTDMRLVYIREPIKYDKPAKFSGGRFATLSDWEYWTNRSNKALKSGAKEFIEIPLTEIDKINTGKLNSRIFVKTENNDYRITVDSHVSEEIKKFQNAKTEGETKMPLICFETGGEE
jgi:hypothetical protein